MSRRYQRKERIGELYLIFYDRDDEVLNRLDEVVEETGCKKREIVIRALKEYFDSKDMNWFHIFFYRINYN